ncbi:MAG: hypothetical protein HKN41_04575 [Ilumatobacter sp.]|nr:hypothetical protein [Ilumatobacter sp.]
MVDDLDELLSLIDEPVSADELAAAESRVWGRLSGEAELRPNVPGAQRRRSWLWPAVAAAVVLVVAGLLAVTATRDDPSAPANTPPSSTLPSTTIADRAQACDRFQNRSMSLTALVDAAATVDAATALTEAVAALDALAGDLAAAGAGDGELDDLEAVRGGVRQAALHAAEGDASAAVVALEFARRTYADSELSRDGCLG